VCCELTLRCAALRVHRILRASTRSTLSWYCQPLPLWWDTSALPVKTEPTVHFVFRIFIFCCAVVTCCNAEEFTKYSSASGLCAASAGAVPLNASIGLAEALDVVRGVLGVAPIEAAAFVAKFYGRLAHNQSHVLVFVKV
jgi:hypothetical protein